MLAIISTLNTVTSSHIMQPVFLGLLFRFIRRMWLSRNCSITPEMLQFYAGAEAPLQIHLAALAGGLFKLSESIPQKTSMLKAEVTHSYLTGQERGKHSFSKINSRELNETDVCAHCSHAN